MMIHLPESTHTNLSVNAHQPPKTFFMNVALVQIVFKRFSVEEHLAAAPYINAPSLTVLQFRTGDIWAGRRNAEHCTQNKTCLYVTESALFRRCAQLYQQERQTCSSLLIVISDNASLLKFLNCPCGDALLSAKHNHFKLTTFEERDLLLLAASTQIISYSVYPWGSEFVNFVSQCFGNPIANKQFFPSRPQQCTGTLRTGGKCNFSGGLMFTKEGLPRETRCRRHPIDC
jgi:hypothetical protein